MINRIGGNYNIYGDINVQECNGKRTQIEQSSNSIFNNQEQYDYCNIIKPMSEDMTRESRGFFSSDAGFFGTINGNNAQICVSSNGFRSNNAVGYIGENKMDISYSNSMTEHSYKGTYNEDTFELNLNRDGLFGGTRYITGTMNDEPFEIDLQNSKIPEDKDVQDILTTVLLLNGEAAETCGNQFIDSKCANWVNERLNENAATAAMIDKQ